MDNKLDSFYGISPTMICWGTSITQGAGSTKGLMFTNLLRRRLRNSRLVFNAGIGGQTSSQIASRQGGRKLEITVSGNAFNGLTPVAVTSISSQCLSTVADTSTRVISGMIETNQGGSANLTHCFLKRTSSGGVETYTLKPAFTNTFAIEPNAVFFPDEGFNHLDSINVFEIGQNNQTSTYFTTFLDDLNGCIDQLSRPRRFIVCPILAGTRAKMDYGDDGRLQFESSQEINEYLQATYPDNYVSHLPPTEAEMAAINYTPTADDLIDISDGLLPRGFRADTIHFNNIGHEFYANRIKAIVDKFNW